MNAWVCFNFKARVIIPMHYTIVTDHHTSGWQACFTTSWVVEGSDDGLTWKTIDERQDAREADRPDATIALETKKPMRCQYLRSRGTVPTPHPLEMKSVEVHGWLLPYI
jgi:hypothetical protein